MGNAASMSAEMIRDEQTSTGLSVWGLVHREDGMAQPEVLQEALGVEDGWHVGELKKDPPNELVKGQQWLDSGYLSFPGIEARKRKLMMITKGYISH